ncbi:hypothetical protein VPH35_020893 [Triticum aestivum]
MVFPCSFCGRKKNPSPFPSASLLPPPPSQFPLLLLLPSTSPSSMPSGAPLKPHLIGSSPRSPSPPPMLLSVRGDRTEEEDQEGRRDEGGGRAAHVAAAVFLALTMRAAALHLLGISVWSTDDEK